MKKIVALLIMVLAGCASAPPPPLPVPALPSFRDSTAPVASQTDVTAARMAGAWFVREQFVGGLRFGPALDFAILPDEALQLRTQVQRCTGAVCTPSEPIMLTLEPSGPGRWAAGDEGDHSADVLAALEIWVHWMDFDSRTLALGTPSGTFGMILDRAPTGGRDRITAARDIFDWFGYDVAQVTREEL